MILVSGAGGKTGQAIISALSKRGAKVRALVRRAEQIPLMKTLGAQDCAVGNMRRPADVEQAINGARAVYHICPNMARDEVAIGKIMIAAAKNAHAAHFVYHSVLHPQIKAMPHHWRKMRVEERLFEAGIPFTILQPAAYMQNVLAGWRQIIARGVYSAPYAVETRLGMVDLLDVAEAAAIVLTQTGHQGAIYELAGSETLTQAQVAEILSQQLDRPVRAEQISLEQWQANARQAGLSHYAIETLLKMFRYYEAFGFWGNSNTLTWLLGRSPNTFRQFIQRQERK
ncbi:MAG TPA: nucleoside-diphosphate sugar epimerase [Anaerolineae bacterium]|nr:nucleoside-diphosphate sugar epimerase [Anaerolineae bacterium]